MRIDDPGGTGGGYHPLPKPKPKPKPVAVAPHPASRPPGVAAPYKPKQKGTSPLKPANFSTITASARSRVTNTYAPASPGVPGAGTPYAKPTYGAAPAPSGYKPVGPRTGGQIDPITALQLGMTTAAGTTLAGPILAAAMAQNQPVAGQPGTQKGGGRSGGGSGYYPRAYYAGGGSGGGGGGGGGASEFERYGMTKDWMQAYKAFWGHALPQEYWGMFSPVQELFSRYQSRLPQMDDWQRIWQAAKDYQVGAGKDAKNMPKNLALYEPWIAQGVRPPLFTPPAVSYAPFLSF